MLPNLPSVMPSRLILWLNLLSICSAFVLGPNFATCWSYCNKIASSSQSPQPHQFSLHSTTRQNLLEDQPGYVIPEEVRFPEDLSDEWELDCFSRPVETEDKKKLWEVLITDRTGSFRYLKVLPSNVVNSRTLRKIVEDLIDVSPVRPRIIRFFRNQMYNMITIALNPLDLDVKPSRSATNLCMWLQEREENIYPKMSGYNPQLRQQTILDYEVNQAERLPDVLRAQSYAFVALPAEVFWEGQVSADNIKRGRLCSIRQMPKTGWIHGITLFSKRADSIAAWLSGLEIGSVKADLLTRELLMNTDITTQYVIAPLLDAQKKEARIYEKGKSEALGYHFLSVQFEPESEGVEGFFLMREFGNNL